MKKLFLLLLLPLQVAATDIIYQCENWTPIDVCTSPDGLLTQSYRQWMWDFGQYVPITHFEYLEESPVEDPINWIRKHKVWYFQSGYGEDAQYTSTTCHSYCPQAAECGPDEIPDHEGFCTEVEWGPYACGIYSGDMPCNPDTGEPTEEFVNNMFAEGLLHVRTDHTYQREVTFANRWATAYFATGVTNPISTALSCNQACELTPNCEPDEVMDDLGFCVNPGEEPVPWDIPADDVSYPHWYNALLGAAQQSRRDGSNAINYMSFAYRDPATNQYRYTGLFQVTSLEATLDWVTTSGYTPVAYIIIHPLAGFVTTGPREYDYLMKTEVQSLNPSILYFYVYTQTNQMVLY